MSSPTRNYAFLGAKDQASYFNTCLRIAVESSKNCLQDDKKYIEIEFPPNRKSDLSVTETLDTNRAFVREFAKAWKEYNRDLWVVFPDANEANLAKTTQGWGTSVPFTITSINAAVEAPEEYSPKLIIAVNPGFNVEEWIALPALERRECPIIVINGSLDRLRNGYYPRIFYPGLYKASQQYYSKFTQAVFLSPIAIDGNRFGGWLTRLYPGLWDVLVRDTVSKGTYTVISSSERTPNPTDTWKLAKKEMSKRTGGGTSLF
eukprot:CAMPEP_0182432236 /NCGR_PEP_ID=MMETSP1167-20130531/54968_1 /TAXON_ID=2988 /ORGANISM="Mallomonas Sp, Strain CCMP3275" /LENGTH=260 /DNA_ID=CAMNT_0024619485 /DNA_START=194 /DNA_END=976 /DNA_ORIENTATION=-